MTPAVAATVLAHGTGALNIDGCRIGLASGEDVAALNARSGGRRGFASEYVGGNCTQHQRDVATAVKNAREMALLPYTSTAR